MEELKNVSMSELAIILQYYVDLPIVDQTGLKGRYGFNLQWTLDYAQTAEDIQTRIQHNPGCHNTETGV